MNIHDCIQKALSREIEAIILVSGSETEFSINIEQFDKTEALNVIAVSAELISQCVGNGANISVGALSCEEDNFINFTIKL